MGTDANDTDADDWQDYESGPFCRHFGDPTDCDEKCARCGKTCASHDDECTWEETQGDAASLPTRR